MKNMFRTIVAGIMSVFTLGIVMLTLTMEPSYAHVDPMDTLSIQELSLESENLDLIRPDLITGTAAEDFPASINSKIAICAVAS